jgi:8-oxo-dGTP pyrophosphatase MutT (NUDIX family)
MNITTFHSSASRVSAPAEDPSLPLADHPRTISRNPGSLIRRLIYRIWPYMPALGRRLAFSLAARRVTLGVCAIIKDSRGQVLVAHHTYRPQPWGLPGGLVGRHEQPHIALERELREELGAECRVGSLLHSETENGHLTLYYLASLTGVPRADGVEIDQFRYASPAELRSLVGRPVPSWLNYVWERQAS